MKFSELTCCPFCGNDKEYFVKEFVKGYTRYYYRFDGDEADNADMYNTLSSHSNGSVYCSYCSKYLGNIDTNTVGKVAVRKLQASK